MSTLYMRELCDKATPGPWENVREDAIDYRPEQVVNNVIGSRVAVMSGGGPLRAVCGHEERANAALIARCSPPVMLAVLDAFDAALKYDHALAKRGADGEITEMLVAGAIAQGHDLDELYGDWIDKTSRAVALLNNEPDSVDGPDHNQANDILGKPGHYKP